MRQSKQARQSRPHSQFSFEPVLILTYNGILPIRRDCVRSIVCFLHAAGAIKALSEVVSLDQSHSDKGQSVRAITGQTLSSFRRGGRRSAGIRRLGLRELSIGLRGQSRHFKATHGCAGTRDTRDIPENQFELRREHDTTCRRPEIHGVRSGFSTDNTFCNSRSREGSGKQHDRRNMLGTSGLLAFNDESMMARIPERERFLKISLISPHSFILLF